MKVMADSINRQGFLAFFILVASILISGGQGADGQRPSLNGADGLRHELACSPSEMFSPDRIAKIIRQAHREADTPIITGGPEVELNDGNLINWGSIGLVAERYSLIDCRPSYWIAGLFSKSQVVRMGCAGILRIRLQIDMEYFPTRPIDADENLRFTAECLRRILAGVNGDGQKE